MGAPVLLVHDDIATIAAVRRLLTREGYEVILATSVADALIGFGHHLPVLVVLAPAVEGGRGHGVLEELLQHPAGKKARVLLLGEPIAGFSAPVAPLPLDGTGFMAQVTSLVRAPTEADAWHVVENRSLPVSGRGAPADDATSWHATAPHPVAGDPALANALFGDLTPLHPPDWKPAATTRKERTGQVEAQQREGQTTLLMFSALKLPHQEEAQAKASLDSALGTGKAAAGNGWGGATPTSAPAAAVDGAGAGAPVPGEEAAEALAGTQPLPGSNDVEAEVRAETERLAQLEIEAALAREQAELSPQMGRLAWTEASVSPKVVPRAGAALRLGDEGFFDVDTPEASQDAGLLAEAPFASVAPETPSWMELPPDPEMENTARTAERWTELAPSEPVDAGAAPEESESWTAVGEEGSQWGTEAEQGMNSPEAGVPGAFGPTDRGGAPQTPGEAGKAAWDAAARSEVDSGDGDLSGSGAAAGEADVVPSAWDVLEAELQASGRAREAEEAGLSSDETAVAEGLGEEWDDSEAANTLILGGSADDDDDGVDGAEAGASGASAAESAASPAMAPGSDEDWSSAAPDAGGDLSVANTVASATNVGTDWFDSDIESASAATSAGPAMLEEASGAEAEAEAGWDGSSDAAQPLTLDGGPTDTGVATSALLSQWQVQQEEAERQLAEAHERVRTVRAELEKEAALRREVEQQVVEAREVGDSLRGVLDREAALRIEAEAACEHESSLRLAAEELAEAARLRELALEQERSREVELRLAAEHQVQALHERLAALEEAHSRAETLRLEAEAQRELVHQRDAELEDLREQLATLQAKLDEAQSRAGSEARERATVDAAARAALGRIEEREHDFTELRAQLEALKAEVREQARLRAEAETRASEADAHAREEAETRAEMETRALDAEARAEAQEQARVAAEARAREAAALGDEAQVRSDAEALARSELQVRLEKLEARLREEVKARTSAETRTRAAMQALKEVQVRLEAEVAGRVEAEARAETEAKARRDADSRAQSAQTATSSAEDRANAEILAREAAESRAEAEAEARLAAETRATSEASARAEAEERAASEAKARAEVEERAEKEARLRAEAESRAETEAKQRAEAEARVQQAATEVAARAEVRLKAESQQRAAAEARIEEEAHARNAAESALDTFKRRLEQARQASEALRQELTREREAREAVEKALEALRAEKAQLEAESTEQRLRSERERAELEERGHREAEEAAAQARAALLPLETPPGRPELAVSRSGSVTQDGLAKLVFRLCEARMEMRLELKVMNALRVLWLRDGALVGAVSSAPGESLVDRARADGLIDARQEGELRLVRSATTGALLDALRGRGYLRESESVPLVQRYTEQVFLDALAEPSTLYRLVPEPAPHEVALAAATRPPLHLLAEALRNTLTAESLLAAAGSLRARVFRGDIHLGPEDFGLPPRDLQLLSQVDGAHTLEALLLGAGLPQESALKTLAVARTLGLITLQAASGEDTGELPPELDVRRLESKFEEVQEADYFTVLGLARTAGSEEVKRAYELLAAEFHPLRFAGHPDPALQHRAQQIRSVLSEAAQALGDDRLRAEYARSLLD